MPVTMTVGLMAAMMKPPVRLSAMGMLYSLHPRLVPETAAWRGAGAENASRHRQSLHRMFQGPKSRIRANRGSNA